MSWMRLGCLLFLICWTATVWSNNDLIPTDPPKLSQSQVYFEENGGQYASQIYFQAAVSQHQVRFLEEGLSIARFREIHPGDHVKEAGADKHRNFQWTEAPESEYEGLVWNVRFHNAASSIKRVGKEELSGYVNYLRGNDPNQWITYVKRYRELWYEDLYAGIDLRYYGTSDNQLKYDFILQPEADIHEIELSWEGVEDISIDDRGNLLIQTLWGEVKDAVPYAYQFIDGEEVEVSVNYALLHDHHIGFQIQGSYDPAYPLVIDPLTLTWSSFFHTSTSDDYAMAVCRDALNFVYFTGYTKVLNFPTTSGVYQSTYAGGIDSYVTKLASDGSSMIFSTYLGGTDWELGYGIGVNLSNEPYIAGFCRSSNFPVTAGSTQPISNGGLVEGFLAKLSADGSSLLYGTYIGGSDRDYLYDLVVQPTGEAYVTGYTLSADFPTTSGAYAGGPMGNGDVFVAKFNNTGTTMIYGAVIGGSSYDIGNALSIDASGKAFVVGNTGSSDFPVSAGAVQTTANFSGSLMAEDGFIISLSADGSTANYASYLGGSEGDAIYSVDVNASSEAFITGITFSTDFPTTGGVYQPVSGSPSNQGDGFVARINAAGNSLVYSTYIGGSNQDYGKAIRVNDTTDEAYILGATQSNNFPTTAGSNTYVAQHDIFLTILNNTASTLGHSHLYGGTYNDYPRAASGMYVNDGKITLGVTTHSSDVPMTPGTYQVSKTNGVSDAPWLVGIDLDIVLPIELAGFTAKWDAQAEHVALQWQLNQASLVDGQFSLQRRAQTGAWEEIVQIQQDPQQLEYLWQDETALRYAGEKLNYRILYQDGNGAEQVSRLQTINIPPSTQPTLTIFPNPAQVQVELEYMLPQDAEGVISIFDPTGRMVFRLPMDQGMHSHTVPIQSWPSGIYVINVNSSTGRDVNKKLIIIH